MQSASHVRSACLPLQDAYAHIMQQEIQALEKGRCTYEQKSMKVEYSVMQQC